MKACRMRGIISEIQCALTPTPDPSPQGGGERVSVAAMLRSNMISINLNASIMMIAWGLIFPEV
jgi:hypothetical protein